MRVIFPHADRRRIDCYVDFEAVRQCPNAAELIGMTGQIGCITPGAHADLILVDGDPLADLSLLTDQGRHMPVILQGGTFVKNDALRPN